MRARTPNVEGTTEENKNLLNSKRIFSSNRTWWHCSTDLLWPRLLFPMLTGGGSQTSSGSWPHCYRWYSASSSRLHHRIETGETQSRCQRGSWGCTQHLVSWVHHSPRAYKWAKTTKHKYESAVVPVWCTKTKFYTRGDQLQSIGVYGQRSRLWNIRTQKLMPTWRRFGFHFLYFTYVFMSTNIKLDCHTSLGIYCPSVPVIGNTVSEGRSRMPLNPDRKGQKDGRPDL